jgi:hypothetical protein
MTSNYAVELHAMTPENIIVTVRRHDTEEERTVRIVFRPYPKDDEFYLAGEDGRETPMIVHFDCPPGIDPWEAGEDEFEPYVVVDFWEEPGTYKGYGELRIYPMRDRIVVSGYQDAYHVHVDLPIWSR